MLVVYLYSTYKDYEIIEVNIVEGMRNASTCAPSRIASARTSNMTIY